MRFYQRQVYHHQSLEKHQIVRSTSENTTNTLCIFFQERTLFVWGFDKTKTSLDDLIEFFEEGFENVVNIRQRTIPGSKDLKVSRQFLLLHVLIEILRYLLQAREFIGSVFVTFKTRRDAEAFFEKKGTLRSKNGDNLKMKWKDEYLKDRKNFNDEFDEETIDRIVLVDGFNKEVSCNET